MRLRAAGRVRWRGAVACSGASRWQLAGEAPSGTGGEAAGGFEAPAYVILGLRRRRGREAEEGRARDRRDVAARHHRRLAATRVHHDAAGGGRREASGSSSCARTNWHSVGGCGGAREAWRPHQGTASRLISSLSSNSNDLVGDEAISRERVVCRRGALANRALHRPLAPPQSPRGTASPPSEQHTLDAARSRRRVQRLPFE